MKKGIAVIALIGVQIAAVAGTFRLAAPATRRNAAASQKMAAQSLIENVADTSEARLDNDVAKALPKKEELPGFDITWEYAHLPGGKEVRMQRTADGMVIDFQLTLCSTVEAAYRGAQRATSPGQHGKTNIGSFTGRRIGQAAWQSEYRAGGSPRGEYRLVAVDDRALIVASLEAPVVVSPRSFAREQPVLNPTDLRLLEDHVLRTIERLTDLGYTSHSTNPVP